MLLIFNSYYGYVTVQQLTQNNTMIYFYCPPVVDLNPRPYQPPQEHFLKCGFKPEQNYINKKIMISPIVLQSVSSQEQFQTMDIHPKNKNQKTTGIDKTEIKDSDYTPDSGNLKRKRKSKQSENRNVIPNIIRLILSYVQRKGKCQKQVLKLMQQQSCDQASLQRYFNFHKLIKQSMNTYVHQKSLTRLTRTCLEHLSIYSQQEQKCYNKITRCLIFHFLRNDASLCVYTSRRMDTIKKKDHLQAIKSIVNRLAAILNQNDEQ